MHKRMCTKMRKSLLLPLPCSSHCDPHSQATGAQTRRMCVNSLSDAVNEHLIGNEVADEGSGAKGLDRVLKGNVEEGG